MNNLLRGLTKVLQWFKGIFQKKPETRPEGFLSTEAKKGLNQPIENDILAARAELESEKEIFKEEVEVTEEIDEINDSNDLLGQNEDEVEVEIPNQNEVPKNESQEANEFKIIQESISEELNKEKEQPPPQPPPEEKKMSEQRLQKKEGKKIIKMTAEELKNTVKQRLEVLLFMSREPLGREELAKFLQCDMETLDRELTVLQSEFDSPQHGIQIIQVADKYQFATKSEYTKVVEDYINAPTEVSLSTAALETLSIIAYRQPITRTEIEAIRGVNSDGIIKSLMDKEFIDECGKADTIGRPTLYGTTDLFLKHFGLRDLEDLPPEPKNLMASQETEDALKIFRHSLVAEAEMELAAENSTAESAG